MNYLLWSSSSVSEGKVYKCHIDETGQVTDCDEWMEGLPQDIAPREIVTDGKWVVLATTRGFWYRLH